MRRAAPGASRRPGRVCEPLCERARGCAAQRGRDRGGPSGAPHAERTAFLPPVACACRPPLAACWSRRQPAKGGSLSGYLRRERATHCGKGTSGARLVHGGKGHPGHALYSKECGRCGLVTLRCALLRASSAAHYLGAGYRWKPPHQDSGELGALSWACPMVLRGRARGYASTGPLGPSLRKGGFDLTCCMAAAAGSGGMRRRLAAAASSGGLRRRLAAASAARKG